MSAPRKPEIDRLRALLTSGDDAQAKALAEKLVKRHPGSSFAWNALGALLGKSKQYDAARPALERAALLSPSDPAIHLNLGNVLAFCGHAAQAETAFRRAIQLRPTFAEAHYGLGTALAMRDLLPQAAQHYRTATQLNSQYTRAWIELGSIYTTLGQLAEARLCLEGALLLAPDLVEVHQYLGVLHSTSGEIGKAIACFRKCLALEPDNTACRSNLLFTFQYAGDIDAEAQKREAMVYAAVASAQAVPYTHWNCPPSGEPLRVGLVSGDLHAHPVGYFLESVLAKLPAHGIEIQAYPTSHLADDLTERLRRQCALWQPIASLSDAQAAACVHGQAPHILVDLAGHTGLNRLALFSWRPAPLQVSWLGYVATTGMPQIDYLIADPLTVPPEAESHFVEQIWRLPDSRMCFSPPAEQVDVAPLPALSNGHVTFGCFNTLSKLNDGVLALWARLINAVPGSRLRIMARQLADEGVRLDLTARLHRAGLDPSRVDLRGPLPRDRYLAAYGEIDIALDPFPFTGGTTTAEALWMGVPVLSLAGKRLVERQGLGLLMSTGLSDWIAVNGDDYLNRAVRLSADLDALRQLRTNLRDKVLASPMGDSERFAAHLAAAFHAMWRKKSAAG